MESRAEFPDTDWSLVLHRTGDRTDVASDVLERLCRIYLSPLYAYFRVALQASPHDAEDLALEFIRQLGDRVAKLRDRDEPRKVRFRDFLRACARHFASNARDRRNALKRRPESGLVSYEANAAWLDGATPSGGDWRDADMAFDREWAVAVVQRARGALADEYRRAGKADEHDAFVPFLTGVPPDGEHDAIASRLGIQKDASKKRLERVRGRFRDHLRSLVRGTLQDPSEVDDELKYLMRVWLASDGDPGPAP
ncbi:MAG: hypothetical protein AB7O66_05525 [Limisphaerales bacterium]